MLATKMLGSPHDEPPAPILNAPYRYYDYEFERYWYFYQVWEGSATTRKRLPKRGSGNFNDGSARSPAHR